MPAVSCERVPDAVRVAVRPIHYAYNDKRRERIGSRRRLSSLVRRCVGSLLALNVPFVRPSALRFPLLALLPLRLSPLPR